MKLPGCVHDSTDLTVLWGEQGLQFFWALNALCFTSGSWTVRGLVLFLFKSAFCAILALDQQIPVFRLLEHSSGEIAGWGIPEGSSSWDICILRAFWRRSRFLCASVPRGIPRPAQSQYLPFQNFLDTGLSFANPHQTKLQRAAVRRGALGVSVSALQMPSNIDNPSAQAPVCVWPNCSAICVTISLVLWWCRSEQWSFHDPQLLVTWQTCSGGELDQGTCPS